MDNNQAILERLEKLKALRAQLAAQQQSAQEKPSWGNVIARELGTTAMRYSPHPGAQVLSDVYREGINPAMRAVQSIGQNIAGGVAGLAPYFIPYAGQAAFGADIAREPGLLLDLLKMVPESYKTIGGAVTGNEQAQETIKQQPVETAMGALAPLAAVFGGAKVVKRFRPPKPVPFENLPVKGGRVVNSGGILEAILDKKPEPSISRKGQTESLGSMIKRRQKELTTDKMGQPVRETGEVAKPKVTQESPNVTKQPESKKPLLGDEWDAQIESHNKNGGSTFNPATHKDMGGTPNIAVSIFPERNVQIKGREITVDQLSDFRQKNRDIFDANKDASIGTWYDESTGITHLDVSVMVPKSEASYAKLLGKKHDQKAAFDLESFEEILTGGTGKKGARFFSVAERLADISPDNLTRKMIKAEDAARRRIRERIGEQTKLFDIGGATADGLANLKDLSIIGSVKIHRGFKSFSAWSREMISEFGDAIRPHLKKVWDNANKNIERFKIATKGKLTSAEDIKSYYDKGVNRRGDQWYREEVADLKRLFPEGSDAEIAGKFLAATSQHTNLHVNSILAHKAFWQWKNDKPFTGFAPFHKKNLQDVVSGKDLSGPKVSAYAENMTGNYDPVTVDTWMSRIYGFRDTPTEIQRKFIAESMKDIAKETGTAPADVQAAVWTGFRNKWDPAGRAERSVPYLSKLEYDRVVSNKIKGISSKLPPKTREDLIHFSNDKRVTIDPEFAGTAYAGAELSRFGPDKVPVTYYYRTTNQARIRPESSVSGANFRHHVNGSFRIYDIAKDPEGIVKMVGSINEMERAIKLRGYDGYVNSSSYPDVVGMFIKTKPGAVFKASAGVIRRLSALEDAAKSRINARVKSTTLGSGPLHELANSKDFAIIGAAKIARGAVNFSRWSAEMISEFGDTIRPYLRKIYKESRDYYNDLAKKYAKSPTKPVKQPESKISELPQKIVVGGEGKIAIPNQVQRIEESGVPLSSVKKPQGLYTTPSDVKSPHADLGGTKHTLNVNKDANILTVETGGNQSGGIAGLKQLLDKKEYDFLVKEPRLSTDRYKSNFPKKSELIDYVSKKYPDVEWNKYFDQQEILEGYAGMLARNKGYEAIWAVDKQSPQFNEYIGLTDNAFKPQPSKLVLGGEGKKIREGIEKAKQARPTERHSGVTPKVLIEAWDKTFGLTEKGKAAKELVWNRRVELNKKAYDFGEWRSSREKGLSNAEKWDMVGYLEGTNKGEGLSNRAKGVAGEVRHRFNETRKAINESGYSEDVNFLEDYVTHFWDGPDAAKTAMVNYFRTNNPFAKQRRIDTYALGEKFGLKPRFKNIFDIVSEYERISQQVVENNRLVKSLKKMKNENNRAMIYLAGHKNIPTGYVSMESPALARASSNMYTRNRGINTVYVHPEIVKPLNTVFGKPFTGKFIRAVETINAVTKKLKLSASFFHHIALTESAAYSGLNPFNFRKGIKLLKDPRFRNELLESGVDIGAPSDVQRGIVNNALNKIAESSRKMVSVPGKGIRKANQFWDWALWDQYHRGLKSYAFYDKYSGYLKKHPNATAAELKAARREIGTHVNNAFGGQNWELLLKSPKWRQVAHGLFLAPDWTLSNIKIATSAFKPGLEGALARKYWLRAGFTFFTVSNILNKALSGHWMWENEPDRNAKGLTGLRSMISGHRLDIDMGTRDEKGRREYIKLSKQVREPLRWIIDPLHEAKVKTSPALQMGYEQVSGESITGWPTDIKGGETLWQQIPERAKTLAKHAVPFSLAGNNALMSFPTSKGMNPTARGHRGEWRMDILDLFIAGKNKEAKKMVDEWNKQFPKYKFTSKDINNKEINKRARDLARRGKL